MAMLNNYVCWPMLFVTIYMELTIWTTKFYASDLNEYERKDFGKILIIIILGLIWPICLGIYLYVRIKERIENLNERRVQYKDFKKKWDSLSPPQKATQEIIKKRIGKYDF